MNSKYRQAKTLYRNSPNMCELIKIPSLKAKGEMKNVEHKLQKSSKNRIIYEYSPDNHHQTLHGMHLKMPKGKFDEHRTFYLKGKI